MKNWLRTKLHNFIFQQEAEPSLYVDNRKMSNTIASGRHHGHTLGSENEPLRFTVYNASGGKIVEINHYDQRTDRHHTSLHIIGSDEDFGAELAKIAFLEVLKKG
jgi:hypothetical protein